MSLVLPREEEVEKMFSRILASRDACERLSETFYNHLCDDNRFIDSDPGHFAEVMLKAYENGDVSAVLLELCNRSMFDLLKEAYLIPKRFHGKTGENPVLLTDINGKVLNTKQSVVSKLYLADGYDMVRYYTEHMNIEEKMEKRERGILILYAMPDTKKLHLSEAQAYDVVWNTFQEIQKAAYSAIVYYGQETGSKAGKSFDELGVLLPIHQFENRMLQHLSMINGLVLSCREQMIRVAGADSLDL